MHKTHFLSRAALLVCFIVASMAGIGQVTVEATLGTAGPTTYTNLRLAFAAINTGTHKGVITIKINSSFTDNNTALLYGSATPTLAPNSSYTSINIYPTATGLSILGLVAAPLIDLNGADNVTIDGRVNATGSTKSLTISNTSAVATAATSTIRFIADASSNTVQYCTLKGSSTATGAGILFFSTATTTGNDNNTITNNDITCAADASRPLNVVYALGTSTKNNDNNTISNNNIYNFLSKGTGSQGINIGSYNSGFTISGNSFYETASFAATATVNYNVVLISAATGSGNGFTVSGNFIGGSAASCGGTAWTKTAQNTAFTAISVTTATGTANSIQGNTIKNFSWTNAGTSDFTCIYLSGATVANIGTVTGNTIGANTGTGSITFTSNTTATDFYGINITSTDVVDCQNNTIGAITVANAAANATNFYGIVKSSGEGTTTIRSNTIGSTATASSINASSICSTATNIQSVYGIQSAGTGTVTISGNTIANMANATSNATPTDAGMISGIYVSAGTNTISNNTVRNLSIANANNNILSTPSVSGIVMVSTSAASQTVSGNTVYSLSNSNTGFTGGVIGIYYNGPTTPSTVSRNFIHSLSVSSSSTTADLYGIKINAGATTYSNNIISLGGNTKTDLFGIYETGAASNNNNLYFNTVYIGGSLASGATNLSYALYSAVTTNNRDFRNNILVNARSTTAGSSIHFALYIISSGGTITCDYNNYFVSGTGGVLGYFAGNKTSLPIVTSNDANSIETNPAFSNAGGTVAVDYTPTVWGTGVTGTGITVPYGNGTRGTSVSMGAFQLQLPPSITSFSPISAKPGDAVILTGTRFNPTAVDNIVFFGATPAAVTAASATSLTVTVPTGATYAPITLLNTGTLLAAASLSNFNPVYFPMKYSMTSTDISDKVDFTTGFLSYSVAIGDLDGDGKADLAVAVSNANIISILRNTSTSGNISFADKVDFATSSSPRNVAIGDLDGDGKPDLAVGNSNSISVSVLRNTSTSGNISFAAKVDFTTGSAPYSVAIGDLDGDGKPDLAVGNSNSTSVSVLRNTSTSGNISFAAKVDFTTGSTPYSVAIGDLDGDGKSDLAVANQGSNTVSVLRNTSTSGSIGFATKVDFTTGSDPYYLAIGDLDGDGKSDLAVTNTSSNTVSVLHNTSTSGSIAAGSFAAKVDFTTGSNPLSVAIGDLDGDGKPDLTVTNNGSHNVSIFRNSSTSGSIAAGSFAAKVDFTTGSNPWFVAIGDLDGDSKPDLAVANYVSGSVSVLRNTDCINPTSGGTIAAAQSGISPFDPGAFTSSASPSGHGGTLEYKWQSSTTSSSAGFSEISGATSETYDPEVLTQTTWYKRLARVSCKSDWTGAAESNVLEMTMYSEPSAQPTVLYFSSTGSSPYNLVGRFTASGSATGYLVVRSTGSAPTFTPTDGTAYTMGSQTGGEIVYSGSLTSFTDLAVTNNITYHYAIYAYNGTGASTNYRLTSPLIGVALPRSGSTGSLSSSSTASTLSFPAAGVSVNFPAGTIGTNLTVSRTASAPSSNIQVNSSIRGKKPMYFSITSTTRSPGTYTMVVDFSALGPLTNAQWNSYKITKRKNNKSPWVDITRLGATIVSRNTDGVMGKFTIRGLSSFSEFSLDEEYDGVLTTNLDQTTAATPYTVNSSTQRGQSFVTDGIRYDLSKLKVSVILNDADLRARLYGSNPDGTVNTTTILTSFNTPSPVSGNLYELTPQTAVKLEPNTQYWVVFYSANNPVNIDYTTSATETGPASFPGNYSSLSSNAGSTFSTPNTDPPALFSIEATEVIRTWTGGSSTVWSAAGNWTPSEIPGNGEIMTIPNVSNDPVLDGNIAPANLIVESGTFLNMADKNITLTQGFSNDGSLTSTTGKLILAGTSEQGIVGTGSISRLEVNNSAGVFISGDDFMQTITGMLIPTAGILTTNGNLTLKSDENGTARVGAGAESGGYIDGDVVTQRHLTKLTGAGRNGRAWRLVSVPVEGTGILRDYFMGGRPGADLTVPANRLAEPDALGTVVIGHNYTSATDATNANFDWIGVPNQVSSLRYYQSSAGSGSFASAQVPSLSTDYSSAAQGYMLFSRGDRQQPYNGTSNSSTTKLQATGTLKQGTKSVTIPALASAGYVLVGNPYLAVIDMERVYSDNPSKIEPIIYVWDANSDGNTFKQGGYRTITRDPSTGIWTATGGGGANPQYIESHAAFFVRPTATGGDLYIKESHKVTGTPGIAPHGSDGNNPARLFVNLEITDTANRRLVDGAVVFFDAQYKEGIGDAVDIASMSNITAGAVGLKQSGLRLAMEGRPWPADSLQRSIPVDMRNLGDDPYVLRLIGESLTKDGFRAWLKDRHLKTETEVKSDGELLYPFRRTGDAGIDSGRFEIVYRSTPKSTAGTVSPDDASETPSVRLFPNPSKTGDVKLSLRAMAPGAYTVQVLDMLGREVATGAISHQTMNGEYRVLKGKRLAPGQYILRLMDADKQPKETLRMVVE